jgi:hypothetical protein
LATSSAKSSDAGRFGAGFGFGGAGGAGCANAKKGVVAKKRRASDGATRRRLPLFRRKTDANGGENDITNPFFRNIERQNGASRQVDGRRGILKNAAFDVNINNERTQRRWASVKFLSPTN